MAKILCRTKNNVNPKGKPRVYFTCHPDDFKACFDKLCEDIFKTHDCAVFYTEDMTEVIAAQDQATDLESNNLFVVPVTDRLLSQPNRAMDADIPFALEKRIPVLPFMMEWGLEQSYTAKFGERQYLMPYSTSTTEVPYEEKLKKYLDSVLISDEMAMRIRAAFYAYIFLSYRKKDRRYANELMRLIHSHPACRDIAIWYDEFLTPGESFRENIRKALSKSGLFALLVTPNLLEEPNGKPNFVMGEEYPAARAFGIEILPAEMEETDKDQLAQKFDQLPACVSPSDEAFTARLLEVIAKITTAASEEDPTHNFLIGLAYLEGIDVEVDRDRGEAMITAAAEADLPEAINKLVDMHYVATDYSTAVKWCERLVAYYQQTLGEEALDTLEAMNRLAMVYHDLGDYQKALALQEKVCALSVKVQGEEDPDTLVALNNLAVYCGEMGDYQRQTELNEKVYALQCRILGKEHPHALTALNNLAVSYSNLGDYKKELTLEEKVYMLRCRVLGEEHPDTIQSLKDLALAYGHLGDYRKELELTEKAYMLRCRILGEEHPDTLLTLSDLAGTYRELGDYRKAVELNEKAYALQCAVLGENHPDTLMTLNNLAVDYSNLGDYGKAVELGEKVYALQCAILGEDHPSTLVTLSNLAVTYYDLGNYSKAVELEEKVYALRCAILGEDHPDILKTLDNLAVYYSNLGDYGKAVELEEKVYALQCAILGENHPSTLVTLSNLAVTYYDLGNYSKALELAETVLMLRYKILGKEHPDTQTAWENYLAIRKKKQMQEAE